MDVRVDRAEGAREGARVPGPGAGAVVGPVVGAPRRAPTIVLAMGGEGLGVPRAAGHMHYQDLGIVVSTGLGYLRE